MNLRGLQRERGLNCRYYTPPQPIRKSRRAIQIEDCKRIKEYRENKINPKTSYYYGHIVYHLVKLQLKPYI